MDTQDGPETLFFIHITSNTNNVASFESPKTHISNSELPEETSDYSASISVVCCCVFCGFKHHSHMQCSTRNAIGNKCKKKGSYVKVSRSEKFTNDTINSSIPTSIQVTLAGATPFCRTKAMGTSTVIWVLIDILINTGSSENFIKKR